MLNKKEIIIISAVIIILAFTTSLLKTTTAFLYSLLSIIIILSLNIAAKKAVSFYLDSEIEIKIWEIERFGFKSKKHFKRPIPAGAFFPIITAVLTFGYVKWMACFVFDVKAKVHRAAKRHGLYTFSEMTEYHIGLIAAAGILVNLVAAVIGYLIGFTEFARLNIYFAVFNMLPLSDLDGNKIFFGSLVLWTFLAALTLIAMGYALLLI